MDLSRRKFFKVLGMALIGTTASLLPERIETKSENEWELCAIEESPESEAEDSIALRVDGDTHINGNLYLNGRKIKLHK